jgi:SAM-dependent methyltransferase
MPSQQISVEQASANLEYPACPVCSSDRRQFPYRLSQTYRVARCLACGVYYLYPRLTENAVGQMYAESSYYEAGECGYTDASYVAQESALRATFKRLMKNLAERGLTGGDLLEVGCGYGYLLDEARSFFRRRVGTEFSPQAAEIARSTADEVFVGGVDQIPSDSTFDCVLATQVIEHVYEPLAFIKSLLNHTKPSAHIVLATPDKGGALSKLMARHWPSFKAPEHVVYFDFRTLSSLMRRAGLDDIRRLPYPHAFPLALIAAKFGLSLPASLGAAKIWVPSTTVAAYGRATDG